MGNILSKVERQVTLQRFRFAPSPNDGNPCANADRKSTYRNEMIGRRGNLRDCRPGHGAPPYLVLRTHKVNSSDRLVCTVHKRVRAKLSVYRLEPGAARAGLNRLHIRPNWHG